MTRDVRNLGNLVYLQPAEIRKNMGIVVRLRLNLMIMY